MRDWKLINNQRTGGGLGADELYYLRDDPGEKLNLATDPAASWSLERRRAELAVLRSRARGDAVSATVRSTKPSAQECEMLRSLGYTALAEDVCSPL
jgi:hypothetical protein